MPRLLTLLMRLPLWIAIAALLGLMLLTFADVMLRSILNAPIQIAADLTRILMAIMVFSVMPALSARGDQISVDLLDPLFDRLRIRRAVEALVALFCGVILFWPASRVYDLAERSRSYGDVTEYLRMPVHYLGWFIAAMTLVTGLALIARAGALVFAPHLVARA